MIVFLIESELVRGEKKIPVHVIHMVSEILKKVQPVLSDVEQVPMQKYEKSRVNIKHS